MCWTSWRWHPTGTATMQRMRRRAHCVRTGRTAGSSSATTSTTRTSCISISSSPNPSLSILLTCIIRYNKLYRHVVMRVLPDGVHLQHASQLFDNLSDLVYNYSHPVASASDKKDLPCLLLVTGRNEVGIMASSRARSLFLLAAPSLRVHTARPFALYAWRGRDGLHPMPAQLQLTCPGTHRRTGPAVEGTGRCELARIAGSGSSRPHIQGEWH